MTVVRHKEYLVVAAVRRIVQPAHRGKPDRSIRKKPPLHRAGHGIVGCYAVGHGRCYKQRPAQHDRLITPVVVYPAALIRKRLFQRRQFQFPLLIQSRRQIDRRRTATVGVVAPHRPVRLDIAGINHKGVLALAPKAGVDARIAQRYNHRLAKLLILVIYKGNRYKLRRYPHVKCQRPASSQRKVLRAVGRAGPRIERIIHRHRVRPGFIQHHFNIDCSVDFLAAGTCLQKRERRPTIYDRYHVLRYFP